MQIAFCFNSKSRPALIRTEAAAVPRLFRKVRKLVASESEPKAWTRLLLGTSLEIASGGRELVEFDAGKQVTGRLRLAYHKGEDCRIKLLISESSIASRDMLAQFPTPFHVIELTSESGLPCTEAQALCCIPDKAFRYLILDIHPGAMPLVLTALDYEEQL